MSNIVNFSNFAALNAFPIHVADAVVKTEKEKKAKSPEKPKSQLLTPVNETNTSNFVDVEA